MKGFWGIMAAAALLVSVQACKDDDAGGSGIDIKNITTDQLAEIEEYLQANSINADSVSNGVSYAYYRKVDNYSPTSDTLNASEAAKISYTISTLSGEFIGSSAEDGIENIVINNPARGFNPTAVYLALKETIVNSDTTAVHAGETITIFTPGLYGYGSYNNAEIGLDSYEPLVVSVTIEEIYRDSTSFYNKLQQQVDEYASTNSTNFTLLNEDSGIYKATLTAGTGNVAQVADTAIVRYTGKYLSGVVFDSNVESEDPLELLLKNEGVVIKGFREAILSMKKGEKSLFVLPSRVAYDQSGSYIFPLKLREDFVNQLQNISAIPPNTPLIFEITLEELK
jgi:FKBP-type peptidyl-prolyl cis-trans isomerase